MIFSVCTIESTTADNHESTLGTSTNYLENDTEVHTPLLWPSRWTFSLFGNSIDTGITTANINGTHCHHESCVGDEFLSNCNH